MAPKYDMEKMELRKNLPNVWHTDLTHSIQSDTPYCCFALWCAPCASYLLRKRALYNDMSRYICCAGYMPCSGRCGESKCPQFCLATEVFCCFANSVASTRFLLQDEFQIQTTKCDNCIIGFMFCLSQVACIFSIVACIVGIDELSEASQMLTCLADIVYCTHNIRWKWTRGTVSSAHSQWQCLLPSKCHDLLKPPHPQSVILHNKVTHLLVILNTLHKAILNTLRKAIHLLAILKTLLHQLILNTLLGLTQSNHSLPGFSFRLESFIFVSLFMIHFHIVNICCVWLRVKC